MGIFWLNFWILNCRNTNRTRIETIVLHSMSDAKQRSLAFCRAASNTRKVILATNIAESSITVPDVKYGELVQLCLRQKQFIGRWFLKNLIQF